MSSRELIRALQARIQQVALRPQHGRVTSGSEALDGLLPAGGLRRGTLVEWLGDAGCGATTLAIVAAREACRDGRGVVIVDRARRFYPPAAATWGIELEQLIVLRPATPADCDWALNQALHCPAVAAVVGWPEKLDGRTFRRLQLAAETGGSLGLFVRSANAANEPSWADVRLLVQPRPSESSRRVQVTLLRCRGGAGGRSVELDIDDEAHTLHLAPQLAPAAPGHRSTGA